MHVIAGAQQLAHVMGGIFFVEYLVILFCNFLKQLTATDILHNEINVLFIDVCLIVLDNIWVIELGEYVNLLLNCLEVVPQLGLIHHFNGHFMLPIMLVKRKEHLAKGTGAKNDCAVIDLIVLL